MSPMQDSAGKASAPLRLGAAEWGLIALQSMLWGSSYFFIKVGVEPAPLVLGFVLGPMLEENFRRAMLISGGDMSAFVTRPISAALLVIALFLLAALLSPAIRARRDVLKEG